jgi:hypothetical protein
MPGGKVASVLLRQNLSAVLLALLAVACSRRQDPAPVPQGSAAAEEDAIERCAASLRALDDRCNPSGAQRRYWSACGPMYRQPACRQAFVTVASPGLSEADRARILHDECARAYCPLLAEPKPSLCTTTEEERRTLRTVERFRRWGELDRAIVTYDHGAEAVDRLRRDLPAPDLRTEVVVEGDGHVTVRSSLRGFISLRLSGPETEPRLVTAIRERGGEGGVVVELDDATPAEDAARVRAVMKDAGIAELETRKPCPPKVVGPPGRQAGALGLTVRVTPLGVEMATATERFGTGCQAGAPGPTVPRRGGTVDMALVTACARQIKRARPERAGDKGVVLSASPSTPYREVIEVMDALRGAPPEELFPEVGFAATP